MEDGGRGCLISTRLNSHESSSLNSSKWLIACCISDKNIVHMPAPCKRSSDEPTPFGFQLSVVRSRRYASLALARSAPCGFVPLRQSRRNVQRDYRIAPAH